MGLHPGALLGLPPGFPEPRLDLGWFRYLLFLLGLLWAALAARARPWVVLLAGLLFVEAAVGFWIVALGRPYGLLIDPGATRWAAQVAVTAASGNAGESFLASEPSPESRAAFARWGISADGLLLLPTLVPLLILPASALLIGLLGRRDRHAWLGALLWLAFSTGDLETLRGVGFIPGLWAHPGASLVFVALVAAVLALERAPLPGPFGTLLGVAILSLWLLTPAPASAPGFSQTLLILTLDQGAWLWLGVFGLVRGAGSPARVFALAGALLLVAGVAFPVDGWGAQAFYRLGLILAATGPLEALLSRCGQALARSQPLARRGHEAARLGAAALLLAFLPGSFLAWWDPTRLDPVVNASLEPLSRNVAEAMAWIGGETPRDAVFIASPEYAPAVSVLGGRRVLRAPTLAVAADDERRRRAERLVLSGQDPGRLGERYGLTHVLIAPGDFREYGILDPEQLGTRGRFRLLYLSPAGFRVYGIPRATPRRLESPFE